ncbi:hypothetical protein, partial [Sphingomonas sp. SRS2]|uniref:hypothetical protein n=1 Tax=Sphingomonas sp. SRS2 TaxID=133190 RepID=UPI001F225808
YNTFQEFCQNEKLIEHSTPEYVDMLSLGFINWYRTMASAFASEWCAAVLMPFDRSWRSYVDVRWNGPSTSVINKHSN